MKRMHHALWSFVALIACTQDADLPEQKKTIEAGDHTLTLKVGELERRYVVHVPPKLDAQKAVPVVVVFHGGGGTAKAVMEQTGWARKADEAGFLAVFPEATPPDPDKPAKFSGNPQTWNDGSGRFHAGERDIDDLGFVKAMLDDLGKKFRVDPKRIYATGFSNGASMTFRVGVELSDRFAAIASVAGAIWLKNPKLARPVPLLYITGTEDKLNPIEGGAVHLGKLTFTKPPARQEIDQWAAMLGCPKEPQETRDQNGVKTMIYGPGREDSEVVFITIEGMGHAWPGGKSHLPESLVGKTSDKIKATDTIWEFFQKHPRP